MVLDPKHLDYQQHLQGQPLKTQPLPVKTQVTNDTIFAEFDSCRDKCSLSQLLVDELGEDLTKQLLSFLLGVKWGEMRLVKTDGKVRESEVSEVVRKAQAKRRQGGSTA